ncbi:MAG: BrnT family toxin [bacterium]
MRFEWNEAKRRKNLHQHGIDFLDSEEIFTAETYSIFDDRFDYGEVRMVTFEMLSGTVVGSYAYRIRRSYKNNID